MKHSIIYILVLLVCRFPLTISAQTVERVEPLCWWADMKTNLQIMFYGKDMKDATVKILQSGISVKKIHNAESQNYLFVDIDVEKAGNYTFEISKGKNKAKVNYEILNRRIGSKNRKGLTSSDAIYLIMPDRFVNGDKSNDILSGTKQVYDRGGLEIRYGGDIQGMINRFDYMADLGITTIWPTPMLKDNEFYHHYAITDYYKIDPHFGTNDLYKTLVEEAHKRGLKVIQDVVPNHCGIAHWWMKDFNHLRKLLHFRKNTPVIYNGNLMHYVPKDNIYTYFRYDDSECVMVIVNGSSKNGKIDWNRFNERLLAKSKRYDALTGREVFTNDDINVEPSSTMIIHFK